MACCKAVRVFSSATLSLLLSIRLLACSNVVCSACLAVSTLESALASRLLDTASEALASDARDRSIALAFLLFCFAARVRFSVDNEATHWVVGMKSYVFDNASFNVLAVLPSASWSAGTSTSRFAF